MKFLGELSSKDKYTLLLFFFAGKFRLGMYMPHSKYCELIKIDYLKLLNDHSDETGTAWIMQIQRLILIKVLHITVSYAFF